MTKRATKFKVGDKVKLTAQARRNLDIPRHIRTGAAGTVTRVSGGYRISHDLWAARSVTVRFPGKGGLRDLSPRALVPIP